ncbi:MAG: hypothetical protein ACLR7U_05515 [Ruthenibacterium lactatiformans]
MTDLFNERLWIPSARCIRTPRAAHLVGYFRRARRPTRAGASTIYHQQRFREKIGDALIYSDVYGLTTAVGLVLDV